MTDERRISTPGISPASDIDWEKVSLASSEDFMDHSSSPETIKPPQENRDGLLDFFNQLAVDGYRGGLTLFIGGLTVSGMVISNVDYAKELMKGYANAPEGSWGEYISTSLEEMRDYEFEKREQVDYLPNLRYIHLRNAKTYIPGTHGLPTNGALMRFRLAAVDGWFVGQLEAARPNE